MPNYFVISNVCQMMSNFYRKTFPVKMAPWIRVNGSVNRRVLDKYAGTILLYCIENVGLTLFTLCTRFYYLLPIHVYEMVQVSHTDTYYHEHIQNIELNYLSYYSILKNLDA